MSGNWRSLSPPDGHGGRSSVVTAMPARASGVRGVRGGEVRGVGRPRARAVKAVAVGAAGHAVRGAGCRGPKFGRRHGRRQRAAAARHRSLPPPPPTLPQANELKRAAAAGLAQTPATPRWHAWHPCTWPRRAGRGCVAAWHAGLVEHGLPEVGRRGGARQSQRAGWGWSCDESAPEGGGGGQVFFPTPEVVATAAAWSHPRARAGCACGPLTAHHLRRRRTTSPPPPPGLNGGEAQTPNPLATTPRLLVSAGAQPMGVPRRRAWRPCRTAAVAGQSPGGGWPPNRIEVLAVDAVEPLVALSRAAQLNGDHALAGLPRSS